MDKMKDQTTGIVDFQATDDELFKVSEISHYKDEAGVDPIKKGKTPGSNAAKKSKLR